MFILKGKFQEFDRFNRNPSISSYYHLFTKMTRRKLKIKKIFNE